MKKLLSFLACCIGSTIGVVIAMTLDESGELLRALCENRQRFFACVLTALAVGGIALWLVTDRSLARWVFLAVSALGIVTGVVWERANRA